MYGREYIAPKNVLPVFNPLEFAQPISDTAITISSDIEAINAAQSTQLTDNDVIYDAFTVALATSNLTNTPPNQPTQTAFTTYNFLNTSGTALAFTGQTGITYLVQLNGTVTATGGTIVYLQIIVTNGATTTYFYEVPQQNKTAQGILNFSKMIPVQGVTGDAITFQYRVSVNTSYSMFNASSTTRFLRL